MGKYYGVFEQLKEQYPDIVKECPLYYNDGADLYDQIAVAYEDYPLFYEQVMIHGGPVLELCCGSGRLTLPIAKSGVKITAVDLSQSMLDNMQKKLLKRYRRVKDNVKLIHGDMTKIDFDERYNLIFIGATSIRLMEDDFIEFFNHIYMLLNKGGCFCFNFEDIPAVPMHGLETEPLYAGAFEDKDRKLVFINMLRVINHNEKRAYVNFLSFKPEVKEKILLSHTDYRIFGREDILQAAKESEFDLCEITEVPNSKDYFCKLTKL